MRILIVIVYIYIYMNDVKNLVDMAQHSIRTLRQLYGNSTETLRNSNRLQVFAILGPMGQERWERAGSQTHCTRDSCPRKGPN